MFTKSSSYPSLEYCRSVAEPHRHYAPFVRSEMRSDSRFVNIVRMHPGLEKTIRHINSGPDFSFSAISQNVVNPRKWIVVRDGVGIELPVVTNPSREGRFIGLRDDERR